MPVTRATLLVVLMVFVGLPAWAQNDYPKVEVFAGYMYARAESPSSFLIHQSQNAHGWSASISGNQHKNFGFTADFGNHYGGVDMATLTQTPACFTFPFRPDCIVKVRIDFTSYQVLFGPRVTARTRRFTVFAHALFGAVYVTGSKHSLLVLTVDRSAASSLRFASDFDMRMGFGGGLDVNASKRLAIRVIQFDYVPVRGDRMFWLDNTRIKTGLIFKFGGS
ncbi:MAG: hypothetical protein ACE5H2_07170 [Terriglobia bacterium]